MKKWWLVVLCCLPTGVFAASADDILGKWSTEEGKSTVEINRCDDGFCGKIIALKEPLYPADDEKGMAGKSKVDRENPNEELHGKPIIGLQILHGFTFDGDDTWEDGKIYDPENGKTYSCKMTLKDSKTLKVRGYIGFSLLGRTTVWTR